MFTKKKKNVKERTLNRFLLIGEGETRRRKRDTSVLTEEKRREGKGRGT